MTYSRGMTITREQLAEGLKGQNVADIHAKTGLSIKTLYRIRSGGKKPSFETLQRLIEAGAANPKRKPAKTTA